jgi:hypothetical protein
MVTKAKIVTDINYIREKTAVKFVNFGSFFFRLMLQSIENQQFIVDCLMNASKHAKPEDEIEIDSIQRVTASLKPSEQKYRFVVEHAFKCKFCHLPHIESTNLCTSFRDICEGCMDQAQDYIEPVPETPDDHD